MTAAEVKKRVDKLCDNPPRRDEIIHRRDAIVADVLRAIAHSGITRSTTRALAEEALRLFA